MRGSFVPLLAIGLCCDGFAQDSHGQAADDQNSRVIVDVLFPLGWKFSFPDGSEMPHMGINSGAVLGAAVYPFKELPMAVEFRSRLGRYAKYVSEVEVMSATDGAVDIEIDHVSRMHQHLFGLKFIEPRSTAFVRPFLIPQIGWGFMHARLDITDPTDDCQALSSIVIKRFNGGVYGMEAGLEFSFASKVVRKSPVWTGAGEIAAFVSVSVLRGFNDFEYVNVRNLQDEAPPHAHNGTGEPSDLMAPFITISNSSVHYHKVAEVYRTPLRFIGITFGLVARF